MRPVAQISLVVVAAGILAAIGVAFMHKDKAAIGAVTEAPLATPPGITIQSLLTVGINGNTPTILRGNVYADDAGKTLYWYGDNAGDDKQCSGACMAGWEPSLATSVENDVAEWSVVSRDDGAKQWALDGRRLYTFAKDANPADTKGDNAQGKWHAATLAPAVGPLPDKMAVREIADAMGQVLVDARGMTLYERIGNADQDDHRCPGANCLSDWVSVAAPEIANSVGEFTVLTRVDGTTQWAFRGNGLYRYKGDREAGDAYGVSIDSRYRPALVRRYFVPKQVATIKNIGRGVILTTSSGMTLYRRDGHRVINSGHSARRVPAVLPYYGRAIGPQGCDRECTKTWHPLVAPAGAKSQGYWDVVTREDGTSQWAYKGFPLYTYAGDEKPGDMTGNDIYDLLTNDGVHKVSAVPVPMEGAAALYWTYTWP